MTLLFYIDESRDKRHHVHLGLLAAGADIAKAEHSLQKIVEQAYDDGVCKSGAELHGVDIFQGKKSWAEGSPSQRAEVYVAALSVLQDHSIDVLVRGADLASFAKRYPGGDPYRWEFSNLLECLNERLRTLDSYGLVIADQQHEYREMLQRDLADAKRSGTGGYRSQVLERIIDTAHFVDSKLSRMTQLADLAAYVVRRRLSIPREPDPRAELVMDQLMNLAHEAIPSPSGQYFTIRGA